MTAEEKGNKKSISAAEYIRTTFHSSDRLAVLVRNRSRGETIQRITTSARIVEPAFQEWMHFKNEKESCDIYVGMNTLKPEARTRTKEDIQTIRHLYVDIDHDGPAALAKIQQSNLVPSPNYTDSTRVLRVPGFLNRKYDTEFWVHAEKRTDRVYHLHDFRLRTEPIESDFRPRNHSQTPDSSEPRTLSQSEHDWAYAKRALARGDDPEEVIRRIADYRGSEKHDPESYARRTVTKAKVALEQRPVNAGGGGGHAPQSIDNSQDRSGTP